MFKKNIKNIVIITTCCYITLIVFGVVEQSNRLASSEIILIALVWVLCSETYKSISELKVGNVEAKFSAINHRQDKQDARLDAIQIALSGIITKYELEKMNELNKPEKFMVWFTEELYEEIRHLDALGFVEPLKDDGLNALRMDEVDMNNQFNLNDYVQLTYRGIKYMETQKMLHS